MKCDVPLSKLSDRSLLADLASLVKKSNVLTSRLLRTIGEVDRREIYLREACPSMHAYCIERLHLSEGAAYKRIRAARAARRFPILFEMLERSEIHLKGITLLASHLTDENHRELLARASRKPAREIERLVAEVAPRPDVPSRVSALPRQRTEATQARPRPAAASGAGEPPGTSPSAGGSPAAAAAPSAPAGAQTDGPPRSERPQEREPVLRPLAPRRYEIRVTVGEESFADLEQLQDLLAHQIPGGDPAEIVSRALSLLLERTLAQKTGVTDRPRKAKPQKKRSRHIPAEVRRKVRLRDKGRCAFRDARGRRCRCTKALEFHHVDNWARGAEHDPHRIELRCRAHNAYQAELDYGAEFMKQAVAGRSAAREAAALYRPADRSRIELSRPDTRLSSDRRIAGWRPSAEAPHVTLR